MHAIPTPPVALVAVRSMAVVLLLLILSLFVGVCVGSFFCYAVLSVLSSFVVILLRKRGRVELLYFNCERQPNINVSWSISEWRVRLVPLNMFKPSSSFFTGRSKVVLLLWILFVICVCFCYTVLSVPYSLVITCWERAYLLALLLVMFSCVLSLLIWCPGSDELFDFIDSWSIPCSLLCSEQMLHFLVILA